MKKAWILLLVVAMVGALLAVPGTALAKGGHGKPEPPASDLQSCVELGGTLKSSSFILTLGPDSSFDCADVPLSSLGKAWTVTLDGYSGKVYLVTQLRNSIPGDRCYGSLEGFDADGNLVISDLGSGIMTRHVDSGMYYTYLLDLDDETQFDDANCTGGDGVADLFDENPNFVFSAELQGKIRDSITIQVELDAAG
jgi:hypothetical protein